MEGHSDGLRRVQRDRLPDLEFYGQRPRREEQEDEQQRFSHVMSYIHEDFLAKEY